MGDGWVPLELGVHVCLTDGACLVVGAERETRQSYTVSQSRYRNMSTVSRWIAAKTITSHHIELFNDLLHCLLRRLTTTSESATLKAN